jgi:hypothetical protein
MERRENKMYETKRSLRVKQKKKKKKKKQKKISPFSPFPITHKFGNSDTPQLLHHMFIETIC